MNRIGGGPLKPARSIKGSYFGRQTVCFAAANPAMMHWLLKCGDNSKLERQASRFLCEKVLVDMHC